MSKNEMSKVNCQKGTVKNEMSKMNCQKWTVKNELSKMNCKKMKCQKWTVRMCEKQNVEMQMDKISWLLLATDWKRKFFCYGPFHSF